MRKPAQPDWPPVSCDLRGGDVSADFASVALARMDGAGVHLLRVTR